MVEIIEIVGYMETTTKPTKKIQKAKEPVGTAKRRVGGLLGSHVSFRNDDNRSHVHPKHAVPTFRRASRTGKTITHIFLSCPLGTQK